MFGESGREYSEADGVPQTESRCDDLMLAAVDNFSLRTLPKNASSLFIRNFSMDSSCSEFLAVSCCSFCTNSPATPPSASVNYDSTSVQENIEKIARPTDAIALFSGELDFSSTIDEIDSTDETRE